jgi:integrase
VAEATLTVPAARLKGKKGARKRDHVVPLSDRALEIIDAAPKRSHFLFAHANGEPLSNMAMLELLKGMGFGEDLTVHGFRSTFKDGCSEQTAHPNEMSEMALAHTVSDKVEAAYRRGDMREKRRRLMAVTNAAGATSAAVTTAITFVSNALPPNDAVFVDAGQADVFASVSSKTANGFNIVIT